MTTQVARPPLYGGLSGYLAMERGEVDARNNTWSSWKATKRAWLDEKKIVIIAQAGPRAADLDAVAERHLVAVVVRVEAHRHADLAQIAQARRPPRRFPRAGDRRQQRRGHEAGHRRGELQRHHPDREQQRSDAPAGPPAPGGSS